MLSEKKIDLANFFKIIENFRNFPILPYPYSRIWRYVSAVLIISFALFCDLHFQVFHGYPSILVFAAVIFSTWYAGFWPGLMTIVLAVLSIDYFFTKPLDTLVFSTSYVVQLIVFASAAILISSLVESQRRAEQKVNLLIKKQKRFIADASHELFTPLSVIRAQSEVVLLSQNSNAINYKEAIHDTIEEVDRMTKIVENLLELSRNELANNSKISNKVNLREIAEESVKKLKILANGKRITLELTKEDEGFVYGDLVALRHMLINLIQNAIQYTLEGGKISVGIFAKDRTMEVTVQDNGIGIATEHLPYIFDPFYKTDEARKRRQSGAGLGLAIVKDIVDFHKGKINVDSKVGFGTMVTVVLFKV